jgi:hypothetical protein
MNRRSFVRLTSLIGTGIILARPTSPLIARRGLGAGDGASALKGEELFNKIIEKASDKEWERKPIGEIMGLVGRELLGIPYVAGTLESPDGAEVCTATFGSLDCVTYYETVLATASIIQLQQLTVEAFMERIQLMRYRDGVVTDYSSRLHYLSDWIDDNIEKNIVDDITHALPYAERYDKTIDFMSTHPASYTALKGDAEMVDFIKKIEDRINEVERHYIPKAHIKDAASALRTGDIIGITTSIAGLDVSHTGLCYRDDDDRLRLLHASLTKKKVVLDTDLHDYLAGNAKQTGIIVARPTDLVEIDVEEDD